jgi:hypothetical protein
VARALAWLLGGLVLLALVIVATAPELVTDLTTVGGLVLLASAAGIPGGLLLLALAIRRRGRPEQPPPDPTPDASLTPEDLRATPSDESGA